MESNSVVEILHIFPDYDIEVIQAILLECNGDTEKATQVLFLMQNEPIAASMPTVYEEIPEELLKKIKEDEVQEKKRRLKECMQYDKEVEKVLSASLKEYEKEQKKIKKVNKSENNEMSEKQVKKANNLNQIDKNEVALINPHENILSQSKRDDTEIQSYPRLSETKPNDQYSQPKKNKLGFSERIKNIFKSKPKKQEKNEKLDIEIPDIAKTNMVPRSEYDEFNADSIN